MTNAGLGEAYKEGIWLDTGKGVSSPWALGQRWHPRPSQPLHPTRCWSSTVTNITPVTKALGRIFGRDSALLECLTGTKSWPNSSVSWHQELQPHAGRSAGPGKWIRLVVSNPWRWLASLSGAVNFQEQPLLTPTQPHTSHPHPHPTVSSIHLRCSGWPLLLWLLPSRPSSLWCPSGNHADVELGPDCRTRFFDTWFRSHCLHLVAVHLPRGHVHL